MGMLGDRNEKEEGRDGCSVYGLLLRLKLVTAPVASLRPMGAERLSMLSLPVVQLDSAASGRHLPRIPKDLMDSQKDVQHGRMGYTGSPSSIPACWRKLLVTGG